MRAHLTLALPFRVTYFATRYMLIQWASGAAAKNYDTKVLSQGESSYLSLIM